MLNNYKVAIGEWLLGIDYEQPAPVSKTVIVKVRLSIEEKEYLRRTAKLKGWSISNMVRTLIFDVYKAHLDGKTDSFVDKIIQGSPYLFTGKRNEILNVRFTHKEKRALEVLAEKNHQSLSQLIRWVSLQIFLDDTYIAF